MAFLSPSTQLAGDIITTAIWNQNVVENIKQSAPDVFTTKGDIFAATGTDAGARLGTNGNRKSLIADSSEATGLKWDWAGGGAVPNVSISSLGPHGIGQYIANLGGSAAVYTWSANLALFVPVQVSQDLTITYAWLMNSAAAAGNVEIGVYDNSFALITSTGAFAMSGTNAPQSAAISLTLEAQTPYFLALSLSSGSAQVSTVSLSAQYARAFGCYQQTAAHPLPDPATPATWTPTGGVPLFGLATRQLL